MSSRFSGIVLGLLFSLPLLSQPVNTRRADSLMLALQSQMERDTNRVRTLVLLGNVYITFNATAEERDRGLMYVQQALALADSLQDRTGKVGIYSSIGQYYQIIGNFTKALGNYLDALQLAEDLKRGTDVLRIKNSIGAIYFSMEDNKNALRFYEEVLKLAEEMQRFPQVAQAESNIGIIYHRMQEYGKALDYYTRCLRTAEKSKNMRVKGHVLNSMGRLFFDMALNDQGMKTTAMYNQSMDKAIQYYNQSIKIKKELGDERGLANTLGNMAVVYKERGQFEECLSYYKQGLDIALRTNYIDWLKEGYSGMWEAYEGKGDYKNALESYKKYRTITDSILNANVKEDMAELQGKYNTEKKDKEIELYKKEQDLTNAKLSQQRMLIWFSGAGLLIVAVFSFFMFRGYKEKQKINAIIEEKNKSITDSIVYARRIQTAILPSAEVLRSGLGEHFVFYKPKDIVSGDFYFYSDLGRKKIFAVADCTGHGVPGAFMSMIGNSLLSEIINEKRITKPSEILDQLHAGVAKALQQHEAEANDGMDIAICAIDRESGTLEYAGANRNLWICENGILTETAGDKFPIGGRKTDEERRFTGHLLKPAKGSMIYLSTDGFADQFGGPDGKKFRTKRFKELLQELGSLSASDQQKRLEETLVSWMGTAEQLDDVLVAGIRV